jgi:folate-binding protein YgfZ
MIEDLSETLGVLVAWDGKGSTEYGLVFDDPRLPALGLRVMLPPHLAAEASADLGASLVEPREYEAYRIGLGVPRGGLDFLYSDAFPHEADMDQLGGVDFQKGCYVGQEIVSRMEHRGTARTRIVPVGYDLAAPDAGVAVLAGERQVGMFGSSAGGNALALLRLDRVSEALAAGETLTAGGIPIVLRKSDWARFAIPGHDKAAT